MCRIITVVNMMVTRCDNQLLQPGRFPGHIHVHPVVAKDVLKGNKTAVTYMRVIVSVGLPARSSGLECDR